MEHQQKFERKYIVLIINPTVNNTIPLRINSFDESCLVYIIPIPIANMNIGAEHCNNINMYLFKYP